MSSFAWTGKKCVIIGGAGMLGGHIVRLLAQEGAAVTCFDLAAYTGEGEVRSVLGSVTDRAALDAALADAEIVFHTASIIDIRPRPALRMEQINVGGTVEVVQSCKATGVGTLVYTSSLEVVSGYVEDGEGRRVMQHVDGLDESAPIPSLHHLEYATTKATAERLVLAAHGASGLRTVSIRPGYIIGAGNIGQRLELEKARARGGHYVTAKVPAQLSTVEVSNCAHAHLLAAARAARADVGGKAFFVRDFEANVVDLNLHCFAGLPVKPVLIPLPAAYAIAYALHLVDLLLHAVCALLGRVWRTSEEVLSIRAVGMAYIDIVVSGEAARRALGYEPKVSKAQCLDAAAEWCREFYAQLEQRDGKAKAA